MTGRKLSDVERCQATGMVIGGMSYRQTTKRFRRIAVSMLVCAVMSIIIGIVIMVEARHGKFPLLSGSPIWPGVIVSSYIFLTWGRMVIGLISTDANSAL
jgi:hypothetical protein